MKKIRIGIAGYGNLGKGVEMAIRQNEDMELAVTRCLTIQKQNKHKK